VAPVAMPEGVDWASGADLPAIAEIDRQATGADRRELIALLATAGRLAVTRDGGAVSGYAALRPFGRGEVAGPVIARSSQDAERLLSFLFAQRTGVFMRVDTTEAMGLASWLAAQGLVHVGGGVAMRRADAAAPVSSFHSFALAAQALG
ncbi:MAG TPA: GNAT family N-acetyltransferase, partial [Paracoccaceae bacterium]